MTDPSQAPRWEQLVNHVSAITEQPANSIQREARIIGDLGFDSVALAELVVVLIDEFGATELGAHLDAAQWERATLGHVFDQFVASRPQPAMHGTPTRDPRPRRVQ